jgi:acetyl esterase/lipase
MELDPSLFDDAAADPDTLALNVQLERLTRAVPNVIDDGVAPLREAFDKGRGLFGVHARSELGEDRVIPGPGGDLGIRVVVADRVGGVYLHFHGGGWIMGSAGQNDERLEGVARRAGVAVVSVDYRLAPEHPYPAPADDAEAAAVWIVSHAASEFGSDRIVVGGESAGGHLAATAALRLRDRHGFSDLAGAVLTYAPFDLGLTPSARNFGTRPLVLTTPIIEWLANAYAGGADVTDPDVSPLRADLTGFPPTLVVVGTNDPLLDDSLLMAERLGAAGSPVQLHIEPGAAHGFTSSDTAAAQRARAAIWRFIAAGVA